MLLAPEVCGPRVEVVKLEGLTGDTSFLLPPFSYILNMASEKVSGSGGFSINMKLSGEDPFGTINVGGNASPFNVNTIAWSSFAFDDEEKEILLEGQSSWSGREVNLWIVIVRLQDE